MIKKFRIWDIETRQFFYWSISENPPTCLLKTYIESNTEQFTGLKDRNNKDIYEGDFIKHIDFWGRKDVDHIIGKVVFKDGSYSVHAQGADEKYLYYGWIIKGLYSQEPLTSNSSQEVVGNIHTNPELLEG